MNSSIQYTRAPLVGAACALAAGSIAAPTAGATPQSPFAPSSVIDTTGDVLDRVIIGTGAVNDDGLDDLVLFLDDGQTIGYKLNLGGGQFAPAVPILNVPASSAVGDMNSDGLIDFLFIDPNAELNVNVALNLGDGTFGTPTVIASSSAGAVPFLQGLFLEDIDLDGQLDILAFEGFGPIPVRALGQGDGTASSFAQYTSSLPAGGRLTFGDVDGDLIQDVVLSQNGFLAWGKGLGGGLFDPRITIATLNTPPLNGAANLLDVDADGLVDIVFDEVPIGGMESDRDLRWIRSEGAGSFSSPMMLLASVGRTFASAPMDFDLDGDEDLLRTTGLPFRDIEFIENLGGSSFAPPIALDSIGNVGFLPTIFDTDGDGDLDLAVISDSTTPPSAPNFQLELFDNRTFDDIGTPYCSGFFPNSTGVPGALTAFGSTRVELNRVELTASSIPTSVFGFFIGSQTQSVFTMGPITLCLAGSIGRFLRPGEVQQSSAAGSIGLTLDLMQIPQPQGFVAVQPGDTWNFQLWHRDQGPGGLTSNLTAPVSITF